MIEAVEFEVLGTPAPKGSSRAIMRGGYAVNVAGSSDVGKVKLKSWERSVRERAAEVLGSPSSPRFVGVPLAIDIEFRMARPSSHWGKGKNAGTLSTKAPPAPLSKPDIDKLARSTLDALTGSVFDDDARISRLSCEKVWAAPGREGARIVVSLR